MKKQISQELMDRHSVLIRKPVKKQRSCLKCRKKFLSNSYGHRRCAQCEQAVEHWSENTETLGA